jgi:hypothetical protein
LVAISSPLLLHLQQTQNDIKCSNALTIVEFPLLCSLTFSPKVMLVKVCIGPVLLLNTKKQRGISIEVCFLCED